MKIKLTFAILLITILAQAQWTQTNGPKGNNISAITALGSNLFAASPDGGYFLNSAGGVFLSADSGANWTLVNTGLTNNHVNSLAVIDSALFAGSTGGVFQSYNNGGNWTPVNKGLSNLNIKRLVANDTNLYACTAAGLFLSADKGSNWKSIYSTTTSIYDFIAIDTNLYIANDMGVYRSIDKGSTWKLSNTGMGQTPVLCFSVIGTKLFAGTTDGNIYLSINKGANWTLIKTGLVQVKALAAMGDSLLAASFYTGMYITNDNGTNWSSINTGLTDLHISSVAVVGANIFAGSFNGGVYKTANGGMSWSGVNIGFKNTYVTSLVMSGTGIFAGTGYNGVYFSSDNGVTWSEVNAGLPIYNLNKVSLGISGNSLFVGDGGGQGIYRSIDSGKTWQLLKYGIYVNGFATRDTCIFAATQGGVLLSVDNGNSWKTVNNGLTKTNIGAIAVNGGNLFAGAVNGGMYYSNDNGANWISINNGFPLAYSVTSITINGNDIYSATSNTTGGGLYYSNNNGSSWNKISAPPYYVFSAVAAKGNDLFASTGSILHSIDKGITWTIVNTGLPSNESIYSFAISGNKLFSGSKMHGVYVTDLSLSTEVNQVSSNLNLTSVYPNPFSKKTIVVLSLKEDANVQINLYNALGQELSSIENKHLYKGSHTYDLTVADKGIYFLRSIINGIPSTQKLIQVE